MSDAPADLGEKLKRLADGVLDDLLQGTDVPVDQRLDAIKAIGTLHLGLLKQSGKSTEDDEDGGLPGMRKRLREAEGE